MSHNIFAEASKFSADHFCNIQLSHDQFHQSIGEALQAFSSKEDQLLFLSEVIRMGKSMVKNSEAVLEKMEATGVASMAMNHLHFS